MKKTMYFLLVGLLVLSACQVDDDALQNDNSETNLTVGISSSQTAPNNSYNRSRGEIDYLEVNLQWISFITGEVIMENSFARHEFNNKLGFEDTVNLNDLIGDQVSLSTSPFKRAFTDKLRFYIVAIDSGCKPDSSESSPPGGPGQSSIPDDDPGIAPPDETIGFGLSGNNVRSNINEFDSILSFPCVELYVPLNVPSSSNIARTITTAHPLTNEDSNYGYSFEGNHFGTDDCGNLVSSERVKVDPSHPIITNILIVARPYRHTSFFECAYLEYSDIDFTEFLD